MDVPARWLVDWPVPVVSRRAALIVASSLGRVGTMGENRSMAMIDKMERVAGFLGPNSFKISLSCGHDFKVERQPRVRVGDRYKCANCGR